MRSISKQPTHQHLIGTYTWFDLRNFTQFVDLNNIKLTSKIINQYYGIVEKCATKYNGVIISYLGDGVGVLFSNTHHCERAFDMAIEVLQVFDCHEKLLPVGVGIDTGHIAHIERLQVKFTKNIYLSSTIIRTYRISSLLKDAKTLMLVTTDAYNSLNATQKKLVKPLPLPKKIKGLKKENLFYLLHLPKYALMIL